MKVRNDEETLKRMPDHFDSPRSWHPQNKVLGKTLKLLLIWYFPADTIPLHTNEGYPGLPAMETPHR